MHATLTPLVAAPVAAGLVVAGLAVLAWQSPRLAGTTLLAVWCWSVVSLVAVGSVEILVSVAGRDTLQHWVMPLRLVAATSTFCPTMALLGAKRPQDRGWQFVVAALWAILSLPAVYWLLSGGVREMHPAQLGFLAILIGVGLMNGLATRLWPSSVLYGVGQLALLVPYFAPTQSWLSGAAAALLGLTLIVAAWTLLTVRFPVARTAATTLDRVWLDFRDAFGAVWGLRIMERMNAAAGMYGWPVTLAWNGFRPRGDAEDIAEVPPAVEESLRTLLRRFVSPEWIDQRVAQPTGESQSGAPAA